MKLKVVVPSAERQLREITEFIFVDNPGAADRYARRAMAAFLDLPDDFIPVRASAGLPEHVRRLSVPGFAGYTLRLLYHGEYIVLIAAFRPGLSDAMRDHATRKGAREFRDRGGEQ